MASFSIRIPDELHAKLRIMAAFKNDSLNTVANEAIELLVASWEREHGPLPPPPESFR